MAKKRPKVAEIMQQEQLEDTQTTPPAKTNTQTEKISDTKKKKKTTPSQKKKEQSPPQDKSEESQSLFHPST